MHSMYQIHHFNYHFKLISLYSQFLILDHNANFCAEQNIQFLITLNQSYLSDSQVQNPNPLFYIRASGYIIDIDLGILERWFKSINKHPIHF